MQNTSFLKIMLVYVTVMLGVLLWSGTDKEKSVYDKYKVSLKGIEIEASNLNLVKNLFIDFLQFRIKEEPGNNISIILPDNKTVKVIEIDGNSAKTNCALKIQLKNGLKAFRDYLENRLNQEKFNGLNIKISEIESNDKQKFFYIDNSAQIKIVFFQRRFFTKN